MSAESDLRVVLGASGAIGGAVVRELASQGHRVRAVSRRCHEVHRHVRPVRRDTALRGHRRHARLVPVIRDWDALARSTNFGIRYLFRRVSTPTDAFILRSFAGFHEGFHLAAIQESVSAAHPGAVFALRQAGIPPRQGRSRSSIRGTGSDPSA